MFEIKKYTGERIPVSALTLQELRSCHSHPSNKKMLGKVKINGFCWIHQQSEDAVQILTPKYGDRCIQRDTAKCCSLEQKS